LFLSSCKDDDDNGPSTDPPSVTAPSQTSVQIGGTVSLSFPVSVEGGFKSSSVTATGGTATISSDMNTGETSGTITVTFTAGTTSGAGSAVLTVVDNNDREDDATAVVQISDSPVPVIEGIPATAEVEAGETYGPITATFTVDDAPGTLNITKNGEAYGDPITIDASGDWDFEYASDIEESGTNQTFEFSVEDSDGDVATQTLVLSVTIPEIEVVIVDYNIDGEETWTADKIYELATRVTVLDGATLNIEPGTVIKGQPGAEANATALLVARGGKLMAEGTPEAPIIFTSTSDDIIPGQIASPNLDPSTNNLWGGVIILGYAPISADAASVQIEGIPPSDTNGLYGGDDPADNSGVITYISIRHGGTDIGEGNEINGLTLGGVGTGTVIEGVEVIGNQDDGIECFGGTVNITNALVWNQGDDAYDMDQAYSGTIDNFIYIGGFDSDHAMELDGWEGGTPAGGISGSFTLINGSLKGYNGEDRTGDGEYIDYRDGVICTISNSYFFNFNESADVELDAGDDDDDPSVRDNYLGGTLVMTDLEFNTSHLSSGNTTIESIFVDKFAGEDAFAEEAPDASIVTEPTVGADKSVFSGWSWADKAGALSDF